MAADRDGRLQPEDKIIGIEKEDGEVIDLVEKKLNDVVRYIRGPRGTKVRLIVQPDGTKEKRVYEITREKIELKEQHAKSKIIESKATDGKELKIGVINLPAFYGDTVAILRGDRDAVSATGDCRRILNDFKAKGVDAVVFDLRGNGGGLLEEAKTLSGLFIDTGPVVQVKEVFGVKHLDDDDEGTAWDGPLVVLIDKFSASASEIFAGVIRDYGRGLIIGDTSTFGKGTVQQIVMINDHVRRRSRQNARPEPRRPEADDSAVLPRQRREHPDQRRSAAYPHPFDERPPRLRRREDGQRLQVRQGRRLAARQLQPRARRSRRPARTSGRPIAARPTPSSRSSTNRSRNTSSARPGTRFRSTRRSSGPSTSPKTPRKRPPKKRPRKSARRRNTPSARSGPRTSTTTK